MQVKWEILKNFVDQRALSIQWIDLGDRYFMRAFDSNFSLSCDVHKELEADDCADFEQNYMNNGNKSPRSEVVTQFEKNDKTTKLARAKAIIDPQTKKATILIKVPGIAGSGDGRYISGGYAISEDYDKDDYATVRVKDEDRLLAWQVALSQNPSATSPASDEMMQAIGVLEGVGDISNYPYIKSYTEDELEPENAGWYFWPSSMGANAAPIGETEVEALGGYGFLPSGFYIEIAYHREVLTSGSIRVNLEWGKLEI